MKRIHVFNNVKIRIWQCKDTGTMNRPLRLAECTWCFRGWMWIFCGVFATLFQFVRSVVGRPLAAVGDRFIVPAYPYISTKWRTEMRLRWNEYTYLIMCKCVFGNGKIRARWIGPYALRNVRWEFSWVNVDILRNVCHIISIRQQRCWQTVSSCRGPIYRARISVYIHKMGNRNACVVIWIYVF